MGWFAGAVAVSAPAYASECANGSTCSPDILSESGTLLASISGPLTASGSFSATYTEAVYQSNNVFCNGCLDFVLQATNSANSAQPIERVNISDFTGSRAESATTRTVRPSPAACSSTGRWFPSTTPAARRARSSAWDFTGTHELNSLGRRPWRLEVETNATQYVAGTVSAQDGGVAQNAGFQPVASSPSSPKCHGCLRWACSAGSRSGASHCGAAEAYWRELTGGAGGALGWPAARLAGVGI